MPQDQDQIQQMDIAQLARSFSPTVVTAPTARNGITLVQRLLNSTRQTMIFGENFQFVQTLPKMAISNYAIHQNMNQQLAKRRQKFLNETTEYWSSDLWPDTNKFMMLGFEAFYKAAMIYRQSANEAGYEHWGIKNPMTGPHMINSLAQLMPPARFVVIYRHPFDVVASAKARQFITSIQQVAEYAQHWRKNLEAARDESNAKTHLIRYETLLEAPEPTLQALEQFVGVSGIDRRVLDRKINTFAGHESQGHAPNEYIEPHELSDEERALIREHAGPILDWAGYTSADAAPAAAS